MCFLMDNSAFINISTSNIPMVDDSLRTRVWHLMKEIDENSLDPRYQEECMAKLKALGKLAAEILLENSDSPETVDRGEVAYGLGLIGIPCGLDFLIRCLEEENAYVREGAVETLGIFGDKQATEPLIELLKRAHDDHAQITVITALGKIKDERAIEPLVGLLSTDYEEVLNAINTTLSNIGKQSVSVLLKVFDQSFVSEQYGKTREYSSPEFLKKIRTRAAQLIWEMGPNEIPPKYILMCILHTPLFNLIDTGKITPEIIDHFIEQLNYGILISCSREITKLLTLLAERGIHVDLEKLREKFDECLEKADPISKAKRVTDQQTVQSIYIAVTIAMKNGKSEVNGRVSEGKVRAPAGKKGKLVRMRRLARGQ